MARKRGGDWVPCRAWHQGVQVAGAPGGFGQFGAIVLVHGGITDDPLDTLSAPQTAVVETTDTLTVERVVGQFDVQRVDVLEDFVYLGMRIVKCIWDADDNAFAAFEDSLFTGDDANSQFLWQRFMAVGEGSRGIVSPDFGHDILWSHLDVQVSRTLEREEALLLLLQVAGLEGVQIRVRPWIRSWARWDH